MAKTMKLSKKQQNDIECIKYFMPEQYQTHIFSNEEVKQFLDDSDKGIKPKFPHKGYEYLKQGKRWRGIHMQMWEDGVLDGTVPYFVLLGGLDNNKKWYQFWKSQNKPIPRMIVDFMEKEMFKGIDANLIEDIYNNL